MTALLPVAIERPARPYPGLRPFEKEEWSIFFGRERMIEEVIARLANHRVVLIHGVSGSGKSSLVRAGVLPKLALQYSHHDAPWLTCAMRPSGGPLWNLAKEFAALEGRGEDVERVSEIAGHFNARSASLASVAASLKGVGGKNLCLLVDQFEELFRYEKETSRDEAELFVDLIERAARENETEAATDTVDLHVIVTMRSEFLGECARFAGFAETINRTQYLVPRMDDDGLMRAVRRPAQMYGAEFDQGLAERLIASVRGREDELPLLQHGLMLMWEDVAGRAHQRKYTQLDGAIVDEAGGLAELLSEHADKVMASVVAPDEGRAPIVEAAFRALIDVNAEGQAIRRPLAFQKLCAVTGVAADQLHPILDAFRAPGVSFITPYDPAPIKDKTPIDVSHEALIRCWRRINGSEGGWLQREVRDGLAWRALLYQAETFANDKESFLSEPATEVRADWLKGRNDSWSQRYGGGWPKVIALVEASQEYWRRQSEAAVALETERRRKRNQRLTALLGVPLVLTAVGVPWVVGERAQQREIAQARLLQEDVDKSAMRTVKTLVEDVLLAYSENRLDFASAQGLAAISGQFLDSVRASSKTSAADLLWAQTLNADADLQVMLNKDQQALALARRAKEVALSLTQSDPKALEPLKVLYDATIRVGNVLSALGPSHQEEALEEYNAAVEMAERIVSLGGDEEGSEDVIDTHMKIGDFYKNGKQYSRARTEYQAGLAASEAALVKHPDSFALLRDKGKALFRIAELLRTEQTAGTSDEARALYRQMAEVQEALVTRNTQEALASQKAPDLTLKSNLAATYTHWAMLEREAGHLDLALPKFELGAALNEELIKAEPGNPRWVDFVAPNYRIIGDILDQLNRPKDALGYYEKFFDAKRTIATRQPGSPRGQRDFADAAKLLGDHSTGLDQIGAYREAVRILGRMIDDPKMANEAEDQFALVLVLARSFDAKSDWPDAQAAYRVAQKIAMLKYVKDPLSNTAWRDKAEAAERALVEAQVAAETAPSAAPR